MIRPAAEALRDMTVRFAAVTTLEFDIRSAGLLPLLPRILKLFPFSIALLASNLSEPLMFPVSVYSCPDLEIGADCDDMVPLGYTVTLPAKILGLPCRRIDGLWF